MDFRENKLKLKKKTFAIILNLLLLSSDAFVDSNIELFHHEILICINFCNPHIYQNAKFNYESFIVNPLIIIRKS